MCHGRRMYAVGSNLFVVEADLCHEIQVCVVEDDYFFISRKFVCSGRSYVP